MHDTTWKLGVYHIRAEELLKYQTIKSTKKRMAWVYHLTYLNLYQISFYCNMLYYAMAGPGLDLRGGSVDFIQSLKNLWLFH